MGSKSCLHSPIYSIFRVPVCVCVYVSVASISEFFAQRYQQYSNYIFFDAPVSISMARAIFPRVLESVSKFPRVTCFPISSARYVRNFATHFHSTVKMSPFHFFKSSRLRLLYKTTIIRFDSRRTSGKPYLCKQRQLAADVPFSYLLDACFAAWILSVYVV